MKTLKVALAAACAVAVGWVFTASADIPASAYVQRGLIAQWDGIDNAGTGTHDANAETWVDRIGRRSPTKVNTKGDGGTWGDNCFIEGASASSCFWCEDDDLKSLIQSGELTVEIYCSHTSTYAAYEDWLGFGETSGKRWLKLDIRKSDSTAPVFQGLQYRATSWGTTAKIADNTICAWGDTPQYGAIVCTQINGKHTATLYGNDTNKVHSVNYGTVTPSDGVFTLGGFNKGGNALLNAKIYSVRLYSRALTASEIACNANIDKIRFRGVDPATLTWPEGYQYDAETDEVRSKIALAFGSGCGTVKVDGAAVQPGWEKWTAVGSAGTLTFAAEPNAGYRFVRWEANGETVGTSAEYTLAYGQKADVRAVFASEGLSCGSYVQAGLVAQWDGIDNQGTGSHVDGATTWKDVSLAAKGGDLTLGDSEVFETDALFITAAPTHVTGPLGLTAMTLEFQFMRTSGSTSVRRFDHSTYTSYFESWSTDSDGFLERIGSTRQLTAKVVNGTRYSHVTRYTNKGTHFVQTTANGVTTKGKTTNGATTVGNYNIPSTIRLFKDTANLRVYSARIYNRELSDAEVAVNAAVDRMRYENADPSSVDWPEGFRFNYAKGDVETVVTGRVEGVGGTVQVGDGTVSPYWAGFSEDVTLTPIPASGYVFYKWMSATPLADDKVMPLTVKGGLVSGIKAFFVPAGADVSESWIYLPLSTTIISNVVTHATLKASVVSGNEIKVTGVNALNGATTLNLNVPIFSQDGATLYKLVNIDGSFNPGTLTDVLLPDSVTTIKTYCFDAWSVSAPILERVRLPQGMASVPNGLFRNCKSLTELVDGFPPSITKVDASAFYGCSSLTTAVDFAKIENFGKESFSGCTSLPVPDGCLVLSNAVFVGGSSFNSMTQIGRVDLTKTTNLQTMCGFSGCSSLTNIVPLYPSTVTNLTSGQRNVPLRGEVVLSNPNFKGVTPSEMWRGNKLGSIDMTGSGIETALGNSAFYTMGTTLTNITFSAAFKAFPNYASGLFYDCSAMPTTFRTMRFRGDPPTISNAALSKGWSRYFALCLPKWNPKWKALVDDPASYPESSIAASVVADLTVTTTHEFLKKYPDDPLPVQTIVYGGYEPDYPCWIVWWYPDRPTSKTEEPLSYFDVIRYDGQRPGFSGENDGEADGNGATNLFNGATYVIPTTGTATADKAVKAFLKRERWLGKAGAAAELHIPEGARTARSLKLKSYRLHQLSGDAYANARAPTAWTLKGKAAGSDDWQTVDVRQDVLWESALDMGAYGFESGGATPPRTKCVRSFDVPVELQLVYTDFRFEPTDSYAKTNNPDDEYPYGLMEIEFYGEIPSPDPVVSAFSCSREGWKDLAFSVTLSSLGEDMAEGVRATSAQGTVEVAEDPSFATVVATSDAASFAQGAPTALTVRGLTPGRTYYARLSVANDIGGATRETLAGTMQTIAVPFVPGAITVTKNDDGTSTVSFEVEALYADEATLTLAVGATADPTDVVDVRTVTAAGTYVLKTIETPEGFAMVKVAMTVEDGDTTYEAAVRKGASNFWLANDDVSPTVITNAVSGVAFSVNATGGALKLTALTDKAEATKIDLSEKYYGPSGVEFTLGSVGTALRQKSQIKEVVLPDYLETLPETAFQGDYSSTGERTELETITLPKGIKMIPKECFKGCLRLTAVKPDDWTLAITNLGSGAFQQVPLTGDLRFPNIVTFSAKCLASTQITSIDVTGAPVRSVDGFASCSSLTNFTPLLPPTVTYLGTMSGCKKLKQDLVFRGPTCTLAGGEHIRGAGFTSFDMSALKTVTMNGTLCFFDCGSMTNVVVAKGVTKLYGNSFMQSASNLRHLTFLGGPASGLVTTYVSPPASYNMLITIPRECDEWMDYFATNTTYFASPTSAERKTFRKNFPGRRHPQYVIKLKQDNQSYFRFVGLDRTGLGLLIMVK